MHGGIFIHFPRTLFLARMPQPFLFWSPFFVRGMLPFLSSVDAKTLRREHASLIVFVQGKILNLLQGEWNAIPSLLPRNLCTSSSTLIHSSIFLPCSCPSLLQSFALRFSKRHRKSLSDEGLLGSNRPKPKFCEEVLTSGEESDNESSDEEDIGPPAKKARADCSRHDSTNIGQQRLQFSRGSDAETSGGSEGAEEECS